VNSRELILRIINHEHPPRVGFDFLENNPSDILHVPAAVLTRVEGNFQEAWGWDPSLVKQVPNFSGELMMTPMGNIFGRFDQKTKGECIKGALQDGWELLESWVPPSVDEEKDSKIEKALYGKSDKFVLAGMPFSVWSPLRDIRHIDQALMDTILEPEYVKIFLDKLMVLAVEIITRAKKNGANGVMIWDDLGMQNDLFFSPDTFKILFKCYYKKLADELHNRNMKFFLHSCGLVYKIVPDLIDAGVDVFQFDQPELTGSHVWAEEFGQKAVFYCPVDIQKIMATGDEKTIREGALNMVEHFKKCGGSLIAKDYPAWEDIDILPEWQQWARDVIIANANIS
jgi:uroporphyrinogen decarboxylase